MGRTLLACLVTLLAAGSAMAQVKPSVRARKFWQVFSRADPAGQALAFDVLTPADSPMVLKAAFRGLKAEHPLVVSAAVDFLSKTEGTEALDELHFRGATHKSRAVRYAVTRALAILEGDRSRRGLTELLLDKDWLVRAGAVQALGQMKAQDMTALVAGAAGDEDARVRVAAMDALHALNDLSTADHLIKALTDDSWQVRFAAMEALRRLRPRSAFEPLVDRLDQETGRLRLEAHKALVWLVGQDLGEAPEPWREWWKGQVKKKGLAGRMKREYSEYAITRRKTPYRKFFKVKTDSRRIVFVLDTSASMLSFSKAVMPDAGKTQAGHSTRFSVLVDQLAATIGSFDETVSFNIILFNSGVKPWKKEMQVATPANRASAISFVRGRTPVDDTNVFDALATALGVSPKAIRTGKGFFNEATNPRGKMGLAKGADTVFFLSDGVPNRGSITEGERIVDEITRVNRFRRMAIHTIAVGRFSADFLRRLAVENWGHCASVGD